MPLIQEVSKRTKPSELKILEITLWFAFITTAITLPGYAAAQLRVDAASCMVVNVTTGRVLFYQNIEAPVPPASLTKVLSLYLVYEALERGRIHRWDKVKISGRASHTGGTSMFLAPGTEITLDDLIRGMSIVSANDASVAVAERIGGSVERFVEMMNAKAKELNMTDSYFVNPHGLPAKGQVSSSRDMMKLARAYVRRFPQALAIHSLQSFTYQGITQHNRNRLLGECPGVDGIKTGHVFEAGYNIIVTARRQNTRLIAVLLGARTPGIRNREVNRLVEMGFGMVEGKTCDSFGG